LVWKVRVEKLFKVIFAPSYPSYSNISTYTNNSNHKPYKLTLNAIFRCKEGNIMNVNVWEGKVEKWRGWKEKIGGVECEMQVKKIYKTKGK
jgi:hypothetical protein